MKKWNTWFNNYCDGRAIVLLFIVSLIKKALL
jgi:hypothetical protein